MQPAKINFKMDFRRLKIRFVKIDFSNLFLNWFRGPFVQGDQIGRGPFVQGDRIVGDRLSRGTKLAGDRLSRGTKLLGTRLAGD